MQFVFSLPPCGNKHLTAVSTCLALSNVRCKRLVDSASREWASAETEGLPDSYRVAQQQTLRHELLSEYADLFYAASQINSEYYRFELAGLSQTDPIQILRYDAADAAHHDWHVDIGERNSTRKLSFSLQLSDSNDYEGGDLEFLPIQSGSPNLRQQGTLIVFPSYKTHRVTHITRGVRYALVGWLHGTAFR